MEMGGLIHTPAALPPGIVFPKGGCLYFGAGLDALETKKLLAPAGSRNATPLSPHSLGSLFGTTLQRTQQYTARTRINGLDSTDSRHMLPLEHNKQYQLLKDPDPVSLNREAW